MQQTTPAHQQRTAAPLSVLQKLPLIGIYAFMLLLCLFCLAPFVWPILSAFSIKPENVSGLYLYIPASWTLKGFDDAIFGRGQALILLKNSLLTTVGGVGFAVIFSALGGYTLSRSEFRFKKVLMYAFLLIQIIPATATTWALCAWGNWPKTTTSLLIKSRPRRAPASGRYPVFR